MISFKEIAEEKDWMLDMGNIGVPLPQSFDYGEIQKKIGRNIKRFEILNNNETLGYVEIIEYPMSLKLKYWYAPYGPVLKEHSENIISGIKKELKTFAFKSGIVFVRLDFSPTLGESETSFANEYFTLSNKSSYIGAYFQPREEWYTKINKTPEEILQSMHSKTRYSVRLSEKKGVATRVVKEDLLSHLPNLLNLMKQTSKRNGFALHNENYYRSYFEEAEKTGRGFLIEAVFENKVLATHFVYIIKDVAHFVFGASSDEHKDLCAPYLAHFQGMLESRRLGASYYNFGAVTLSGENKSWQGLSVFKQKFGGEVVKHSNLFDLVLKPVWYYIYIIRKILRSYL